MKKYLEEHIYWQQVSNMTAHLYCLSKGLFKCPVVQQSEITPQLSNV